MKAFLLAAGLGRRLHPVTQRLPKPMLPLFNTPIIEHILLQLRRQRVREIIVNLHHMPTQILQHLGDGSRWNLQIRYSLEPDLMGTAGGLRKMADLLQGAPFAVINADTYREMDLQGMLRQHRLRGSLVTMLLQDNPGLEPERSVGVDGKGDVASFLGFRAGDHPKLRPADFLGVQIMSAEVLSLIPPGRPWEMRSLYCRLLKTGRPIGAYLHGGYWMDMGTLEGYRRIHWDALEGKCPLEIPGEQIAHGVWAARGAWVEPGAKITPPAFLGSGCSVGMGAEIGPYAVIGDHCVVERGARVLRSILWAGVRVSARTNVQNLLLGRGFRHPLEV